MVNSSIQSYLTPQAFLRLLAVVCNATYAMLDGESPDGNRKHPPPRVLLHPALHIYASEMLPQHIRNYRKSRALLRAGRAAPDPRIASCASYMCTGSNGPWWPPLAAIFRACSTSSPTNILVTPQSTITTLGLTAFPASASTSYTRQAVRNHHRCLDGMRTKTHNGLTC